MRRLRSLVLVLALALVASAAAAAKPPILFVAGIECPAHVACTGKLLYFDHLRRILRVGFPAIGLRTGPFSDSEPAWSPDHKRIAFVRESQNGLSYTVWVMNADGTAQRQLTKGNRLDSTPSWSPDGKRIVFRGNSPNRRTFDLYTINVTGTGLKDVTKNPDSAGAINPDWSPNGKLIVFQRSKSGSGAGTGIYTIRPDGTGLKRLRIGGMNPAWSPGGAKIAFELPDPASGNMIEIYTMNAGGTGSTRLTAGKESVSPAWSPDGSQIVCIRGNQVTLVTVKSRAVKQLTRPLKGFAFVADPAW
jgi:Tol biopolymer transport system component